MSLTSFHLTAPALSPQRDALILALDLRGADVTESYGPASDGIRLEIRSATALTATDPLDALRAIAGHFPDAPLFSAERIGEQRRAGLAFQAMDRLCRLIGASSHQELDLEVHLLRHYLRKLSAENLPAPSAVQPLTIDALVLAPLLWRLHLLDRDFRLYLLTGFEPLSRLQDLLASRAEFSGVLDAQFADIFLATLSEQSKILTPDPSSLTWDLAFGTRASEKNFLSAPPRRKIPSIGSIGRIR